MPRKAGTRKTGVRGKAARTPETLDRLRHKLHDLANSLEAVSLARRFVDSRPQSAPIMEKLAEGLEGARKALRQMDSDLKRVSHAKAAAGK